MHDLMMIGIALAFTSLLLLLRNVIVGRREGKAYRVSVMTLNKEDVAGLSSDAADEWPNVIDSEAEPVRREAASPMKSALSSP
jgi:hypothetical protein